MLVVIMITGCNEDIYIRFTLLIMELGSQDPASEVTRLLRPLSSENLAIIQKKILITLKLEHGTC